VQSIFITVRSMLYALDSVFLVLEILLVLDVILG